MKKKILSMALLLLFVVSAFANPALSISDAEINKTMLSIVQQCRQNDPVKGVEAINWWLKSSPLTTAEQKHDAALMTKIRSYLQQETSDDVILNSKNAELRSVIEDRIKNGGGTIFVPDGPITPAAKPWRDWLQWFLEKCVETAITLLLHNNGIDIP